MLPLLLLPLQALFYAHQLREALGDLRRLDRREAKSKAVHMHGLRLDTRDAHGTTRIIREGRPDKVGHVCIPIPIYGYYIGTYYSFH